MVAVWVGGVTRRVINGRGYLWFKKMGKVKLVSPLIVIIKRKIMFFFKFKK